MPMLTAALGGDPEATTWADPMLPKSALKFVLSPLKCEYHVPADGNSIR